DPARPAEQKCGMRNSLGWAAYTLGDALFIKRFGFEPGAVYADFGCNTELFTNADMLEVESLGPLTRLDPGGDVLHIEHWSLSRAEVGATDAAIDAAILPLI